MFTVNNKDTRKTPLTSLLLNIVNIDILNIEQLSHLIFLFKLLTLNRSFLAGTNDITQQKPPKIKSFLPFNFAITKIFVAIRLAEGETKMDGI